MILTYKIKHEQDFSKELSKAKGIAEFGIQTKSRSSADVKHFGLKSAISNQILKKYSGSKTVKKIKSVKLTIPSQSIQIKDMQIYIPCLKLGLDIYFPKGYEKINQIELGEEFAYISVSYKEEPQYEPTCLIGVDRNTTHHIVVASNINSGKVLKLGKSCNHIHKKYSNIRKSLQKKGKFKRLKRMKNREQRIIRDINHKVSTKLVNEVYKVKGGLVFEDLKGIRKTTKSRKKFRYSLNSWSFYQLQMFVEYKAKKLGVPIYYVEPQYTSQRCCKCGHIERANRKGNLFNCKKCRTVEDSGVNAGFNIAHLQKYSIPQFNKDSDLLKGNTDVPKEALCN